MPTLRDEHRTDDRDADSETAASRRRRGGGLIVKFLPLLILAAIAIAAWAFGLRIDRVLGAFIEHRAEIATVVASHYWLSLAGFALLYVCIVALSLPIGLLFTLLSGFLFGPWVGGATAVLAATIGATLLFLVARGSLGDSLRSRHGAKIERFVGGLREDAFNYLLFLRLVPIAPFWLVNLAPALIGIETRPFVLATLIGIIPATATFATLGAGFDSLLEAQGDGAAPSLDLKSLLTPELTAGLIALGLLALVPVAVRRWRNRKAAP